MIIEIIIVTKKKYQRIKNNMKNIKFNNYQKFTKMIFYKRTSFLTQLLIKRITNELFEIY